jgi:hypothetical protein
MYFIDAVIAFTIPAKRVEKNLTNPITANKIIDLYGLGMAKKLEPEIDKYFNKFSQQIKAETTNTITTIINNDIKHMIDERFDKLAYVIPTQRDFDELISSIKGVTGRKGQDVKAEKKRERDAKLAYIMAAEPDNKQIQNLPMMKRLLGATNTDIDQFLDFQIMRINMKKGGNPNGKVSEMQMDRERESVPETLRQQALQKKENGGKEKSV